ncbi:MAG: hypothetical protein QF535_07155 [Anaerolineales bacterium]|nr:hypothetical protein [Anaerolineales bacterium]
MIIVSTKDLRIATDWGAVVLLFANEPRELAEPISLLALQMGAKEVGQKPLHTITEKVRARDEDGQYIGDDLSTPEINEAWTEKKSDVSDVVVVMEKLIKEGNPENFKTNGTPKAAVINKALGRVIKTAEREAAWEAALNL